MTKAHRRVKVLQRDWRFQVAELEGEWWINKVGTYGMASAQLYWGRTAALILRPLYNLFPQVDWGSVFVDDFCWFLRAGNADHQATAIIATLVALGVPLSWKKTHSAEVNTWLGFVIHPNTPQVQMISTKHILVLEVLELLIQNTVMTIKAIEKALGRLQCPLIKSLLQSFWAWKMAVTSSGRPPKTVRLLALLQKELFIIPYRQLSPYLPKSSWWGCSDASADFTGDAYIGGWLSDAQSPARDSVYWFQALRWLHAASRSPPTDAAGPEDGGRAADQWQWPKLQPQWMLLNADGAQAHRRVKILPEDWRFQVAELEGEWWIHKMGTCGMASAQLYWGRTAALILRLLYNIFPQVDWGFVFVDDFCWILRAEDADHVATVILVILVALGVSLSWKKTHLTEVNTWLGFVIHSNIPQVQIIATKHILVFEVLELLIQNTAMTAKFIENFGRLQWITAVCPLIKSLLQPSWAWKMAVISSGRSFKNSSTPCFVDEGAPHHLTQSRTVNTLSSLYPGFLDGLERCRWPC